MREQIEKLRAAQAAAIRLHGAYGCSDEYPLWNTTTATRC
jgi:hypothetical protein